MSKRIPNRKVWSMFANLGAVLLVAALAATPALADTLVIDVDPPDVNGSYWTGSDTNPSDTLKNSNPTTEAYWLAGLLGFDSPMAANLTLVSDIQNPGGGVTFLTNFNPNVAWDYVVVKYADNWSAYYDSDNNDLVTVGPFPNAISHIDLFTGGPTTVPEPAALLLLGTGLLGIGAGFRKHFRSRS